MTAELPIQRANGLFGGTLPLPIVQAPRGAPESPPAAPHRAAEGTDVEPLAVIERIQTSSGEARARAAGELYRLYSARVFRFILYKVGHQQLAEDLTSATFMRVLEHINSWRWQGRDPGAWIFTIARRLVLDHRKRASTRHEIYTDDPGVEADQRRSVTYGASDPETYVVDELTARTLREAIGRLPVKQREVIELRFLHGLSTAETASALGRTKASVQSLQYRAINAIADVLPSWVKP